MYQGHSAKDLRELEIVMDTEVADELDRRYARLVRRCTLVGAAAPSIIDYATRLMDCGARRCHTDALFLRRYQTITERLPGLTPSEQANIFLSCHLLPSWDGYTNVIALSPGELRETIHEAMLKRRGSPARPARHLH